jgi:hypothetical protein
MIDDDDRPERPDRPRKMKEKEPDLFVPLTACADGWSGWFPLRTALRIFRHKLNRIQYDRWSPACRELSKAFWELPRRPGSLDPDTHDLGIDRIYRANQIRGSIELMLEAILLFEFRPTGDEVARIGSALFRLRNRMEKIQRNHRIIAASAGADQNQTTGPRLRRSDSDCGGPTS